MYHHDTIASLATPAKESALGLIRVSGQSCLLLCNKIFGVPSPTPRKSNLGNYVSANNEHIDQVIFVYYPDGKSFTGEEMIEITFHGNVIIANKILDDLIRRNCRLAEPGEYTKRAFLNGKIDLTQAESVAEIITAKSDAQLKVANKKLSGLLGKVLEKIQDNTLEIQSQLEASIDFPEDDISDPDYSELINKLTDLIQRLDDLIRNHSLEKKISNAIKVTLIGPPNAGKSSLFNKLLSEERSIVSDLPGTTRDYISKEILLNGYLVELIDTAGIRESSDKIEMLGIENTKRNINDSDITFIVIDVSAPYPVDFINQIMNEYARNNFILVRNKTDIKSSTTISDPIFEGTTINTSIYSEAGTEEIKEEVNKFIKENIEDDLSDQIVVNKRQFQFLNECKIHFSEALQTMTASKNEEVILLELKLGLEFLNLIIGTKTNEDMLDKLFNSFCIGK